MTHPVRVVKRRPEFERLTVGLRRPGTAMSRRFLEKLEGARDGLSHPIPGAPPRSRTVLS